MTKVTTLTELLQEETKQEKKPIEFVKFLNEFGKIDKATCFPKDYLTVSLIQSKYTNEFDLILAWNNISYPTLYLGHWNDGVVE